MKTIRINANHVQESFDNQPAITNNGDSKETSILFESKTINIKCLLSNTKACKWDNKYPESHNHYVVKFKYGKSSAKFDFFDSLQNFKIGQTDKTEMDIFEMFYMFLLDCQAATDHTFEEFEETKDTYNACKRALKKFCLVFDLTHIYLDNLASYMQEKYDF